MTTRVVGREMRKGGILFPIDETIRGGDEPNPYPDRKSGTFDTTREAVLYTTSHKGDSHIVLEVKNTSDHAACRLDITGDLSGIPPIHVTIDGESQEIPDERYKRWVVKGQKL